MHPVWMLDFSLLFGWHALLPEWDPSMAFDPNPGLVSKDDIVEGFASFKTPFREHQSGNAVRLLDNLTVLGPAFFHPNLHWATFIAETDTIAFCYCNCTIIFASEACQFLSWQEVARPSRSWRLCSDRSVGKTSHHWILKQSAVYGFYSFLSIPKQRNSQWVWSGKPCLI